MKKNILIGGMVLLLFTACEKQTNGSSSSSSSNEQLEAWQYTVYMDNEDYVRVSKEQTEILDDCATVNSEMTVHRRQGSLDYVERLNNQLENSYGDVWNYWQTYVIIINTKYIYKGYAECYSGYNGSNIIISGTCPALQKYYNSVSWVRFSPKAYTQLQFVSTEKERYTYKYQDGIIYVSDGSRYIFTNNYTIADVDEDYYEYKTPFPID